ncbi:RNA-binding domain-containing protein [Aaosphaeria arxii CBS 175.79]|uniref:Multiple RNA-binding domain-containing protein 1 n=1 Tax=Aaosphaeria arxii CBS 175.79 TaxID=1450172 RepID=A0A6A5XZK1_9PLEO|nr:RNA-binding domain-containing protein [Aaosphaeria arxii CBS 175.79]KAF2017704.1 RNA-binding domain-containing protein [Aaosphaeria arxii CBS 175.79]
MAAAQSSRIFVRGLPSKLSEDDVRKHFSIYPTTDVKFFPHRRMGYIGYNTPEDAEKSVKYFNRSFIRMSKIHVEIARPIADKDLPKSRRQQREQHVAKKATEHVAPVAQDNAMKRKRTVEDTQDPKLQEFLEVMQPPSKKKMWANEEGPLLAQENTSSEPVGEVIVPADESDDEYQEVRKPKPVVEVEKPTIPAVEPLETTGADEMEVTEHTDADTNLHTAQLPEATTESSAGPVSDADWLRSRTNRILDIVDDDTVPSERSAVPVPTEAPQHQQEPSDEQTEQNQTGASEPEDAGESRPQSEEDKILQSGRLYLRNLSWDVQDEHLREFFSPSGPLEEVHVSIDKKTGKSKGFAFVSFQNPEDAVQAFTQKDGTIFRGRLLHILAAEGKRDNKLDEYALSKLPLKKQKEIRRKADAAGSTFNWNSLYLNADAVMSAVASRLGVSKADVLDPTSADAAVKQAQAETHVISELKAYFSSHGVDLESFSRSSKGNIAVLVKNLPHDVRPDEVRKLMEEFGTVTKFLMPPSGLTAIAEFSNSAEAKSAFAGLSYRKFKDSLLYLEWAPKNLFKEGAFVPSAPTIVPVAKEAAKPSASDLLQETPTSEATTTATLYVRNLNFETTTNKLSDTFSSLEGFRSARVKTKVDPKRGVLSMGFGFVEFSNPEAASVAIQTMDGYNLDGHRLQIRASHKGVDAAEERRKEDQAKKEAGTKILIKNLPFEASKKDVRALFAPYGSLRSVRVPKKFNNSSRGFAFADFSTTRDASNAMEALRNTHLLGRRLVLSFAEAEADDPELELEKMQQKVGAQANKVALQRLTGGGRKKFNVAGNDDLDEV